MALGNTVKNITNSNAKTALEITFGSGKAFIIDTSYLIPIYLKNKVKLHTRLGKEHEVVKKKKERQNSSQKKNEVVSTSSIPYSSLTNNEPTQGDAVDRTIDCVCVCECV